LEFRELKDKFDHK
jgi:hypothetical protein